MGTVHSAITNSTIDEALQQLVTPSSARTMGHPIVR
jgi:hypothetical protein